MKIYLSFTIAASKMFFRRKSSIFWSLFFPVVTMLVLGNAGFIGYSAPNVGLFSTTENETINVGGSVFGDNHFRIVDIMGYELDVNPEGNMLFMKNKDVPGVIGRVGTILGEAGVNIGEYLLSRTSQNETAYAVVKLDSALDRRILESLNKLDEIIDIHQLQL